MKICFVTEFFVPYYNGGGEHRYYDLAKRLVQQGHEIDLLTMKIAGDLKQEDIDGITVHHIGPKIENIPYRTGKDFIQYFFSVVKWLLTHKYDIIDAQAYSPLLSAYVGSKLKRTPLIGVIYDTSTTNNDQWLQSGNTASRMEKILTKIKYDKILTISPPTKESLINDFGVDEDNIKVIYTGVDVKKHDSVIEEDVVENQIIFVGRLAPHKHPDDLINVVDELKEKIPNIKLVIVGRGQLKEKLLKLVEEKNLGDYVTFKQDLTDEELIREMKKSEMLVLPSTREGFGMVLAEANCCHKPVIAYKSGGTTEVIDDNITGFLVEPGDTEGLREKIELLLVDKQLQHQMGEDGRRKVEEKYDWDKLSKQYIQLVEEILNEK